MELPWHRCIQPLATIMSFLEHVAQMSLRAVRATTSGRAAAAAAAQHHLHVEPVTVMGEELVIIHERDTSAQSSRTLVPNTDGGSQEVANSGSGREASSIVA